MISPSFCGFHEMNESGRVSFVTYLLISLIAKHENPARKPTGHLIQSKEWLSAAIRMPCADRLPLRARRSRPSSLGLVQFLTPREIQSRFLLIAGASELWFILWQ
jgi:hypothetical protein